MLTYKIGDNVSVQLKANFRIYEKPKKVIYDRRLIREYGKEHLENLGICPELEVNRECESLEVTSIN